MSGRVADWANFFNRELKESAWPIVLNRWSERLAPGLAAAAAHGLIRTAHATRSLSAKETDLRLRELAEGLSYWAAYYQELPENPNVPGVRVKASEAIKRVPLVPVAKRRGGSVTNGLRAVNEFAPFAAVSNIVDTTGKPEKVISELTGTFAMAYLKNVVPGNLIVLLHAVTCTSGLRSLLPYLSPSTAQRMVHYGWLVGAALYSIGALGQTNESIQEQEIKRDDLIERAVATKEEHAIKFTEACLREYSHNANTIYLQAARDALERIPSV
ncbi:MAG TPA: questin oxidase family protein [Pyrinomonadaceae bacterium]|nr:questin oxidase family protein [Pyrinomonadaceae bacterium]